MNDFLFIMKISGIVRIVNDGSKGYAILDLDSGIIITDIGVRKEALLMRFKKHYPRNPSKNEEESIEILYIY